MRYLELCAIARDELDMLEWCAFHKTLGVEKITVYDNFSITPITQTLAKYVEEGFVRVIDWPVVGGQMKCYDHYLQNFGQETLWCGFVDLDEYLVPRAANDIPSVLKRYESFAGLGVSWRIFGSSGHLTRPQGLVIENYTMAMPLDHWENTHLKAIMQPAKTLQAGSNPHYFLPKHPHYAVDERMVPVSSAWSSHSSDMLVLNHYCLKSREEFIERRINKPRADHPTMSGKTIGDFDKFDALSVHKDECALRFVEQTKQEMARISG